MFMVEESINSTTQKKLDQLRKEKGMEYDYALKDINTTTNTYPILKSFGKEEEVKNLMRSMLYVRLKYGNNTLIDEVSKAFLDYGEETELLGNYGINESNKAWSLSLSLNNMIRREDLLQEWVVVGKRKSKSDRKVMNYTFFSQKDFKFAFLTLWDQDVDDYNFTLGRMYRLIFTSNNKGQSFLDKSTTGVEVGAYDMPESVWKKLLEELPKHFRKLTLPINFVVDGNARYVVAGSVMNSGGPPEIAGPPSEDGVPTIKYFLPSAGLTTPKLVIAVGKVMRSKDDTGYTMFSDFSLDVERKNFVLPIKAEMKSQSQKDMQGDDYN